MSQKKILLITTGGTIASKKNLETGYVHSGVISGSSLAELVPGREDFSVDILELFQLPSPHITFTHLRKLVEVINESFKEGVDGIVITHGTDTLEETAYFLNLTLDSTSPVVLTGSQKPPEEISSDALSNLMDSLLVASSEESCNRGVVVVFNGKIFAASEVVKVHTSNLDAFDAPVWGPIGYIDDQKVIYKRAVKNEIKLNPGTIETPLVHIIKFGMDMGGELIKLSLDAGVHGLILEGYGRGQVPPNAVEQIKRAVSMGVPVVLTTRCSGGTVKAVYDYLGSGRDLEKIGVIMGGDLPSSKARIKLILALSNNYTLEKIRNIF